MPSRSRNPWKISPPSTAPSAGRSTLPSARRFSNAASRNSEMTATRSKVFEGRFGAGDYLEPGAVFEWPHGAARHGGGAADLRVFNRRPGIERIHGPPDGPAPRRLCFHRLPSRPATRVRLSLEARRISRGSASGKRTAAACTRPGTAAPSRAAWNSACRLFPKRAARWSSAEACSAGQLFVGCRRAASWKRAI